MDFIQIIQERIQELKNQREHFRFSDFRYYQKHIIRLDERITELNFCLDLYKKLNSE